MRRHTQHGRAVVGEPEHADRGFRLWDSDHQGRAWHARPPRVKRALLIVNPYSTQVTGPAITAVENALRERIDVETSFTQHPGHATELAAAAAADSVDAIVIFSGDGTYNEALNGADGALPVGFLPGGATSVLPRALGLSRDPAEAARAVGAAARRGTAASHHARDRQRPPLQLLRRDRLRRRGGEAARPAGPRSRRRAPRRRDLRADGGADAARAARQLAAGARDRRRRARRVRLRRQLRSLLLRRVGAAARDARSAVRGRPRLRGAAARPPRATFHVSSRRS